MHVNGDSSVPGRSDQPLIGGFDVFPEMGRRQHGAGLHSQILGIGHYIHSAFQKMADNPHIKPLHQVNQFPQLRLLVRHVKNQVFITANIA